MRGGTRIGEEIERYALLFQELHYCYLLIQRAVLSEHQLQACLWYLRHTSDEVLHIDGVPGLYKYLLRELTDFRKWLVCHIPTDKHGVIYPIVLKFPYDADTEKTVSFK